MNTRPGRVAGYAALADMIASDKVFCIFRRFESLSTRNLLYLQDEIAELESCLQLLDLDDFHSGIDIDMYSLHSRRHDRNEERKALMKQVDKKIYKYRESTI
jgi:hypothetical protein